MNEHRFTALRIAAGWALGLGLVAVMLFSAVSPASAGAGGIYVRSVTVGGQNGTVTYGTAGNVSFEVTVLCEGTGGGTTWTPQVTTTLPNGVTWSFLPTTLTWANNCNGTNPKTTTLTLHTTTASPGGVTAFTVDVGSVTGSSSLTVNGIQLTVVGFDAENKVYDGNAVAIPILSGPPSLSDGVIFPDDVSLDYSHVTALFNNKSVAENKKVTANGFALTGAQASNYTLVQPTAFASITKRPLHIYVDSAGSKMYDGSTVTSVTLTTDKVFGDDVSATGVGAFDNRNVGNHKQVTVSSVALSGFDAGNYNVVSQDSLGYADVTPRPITVTAAGDSKQYDGGIASGGVPTFLPGSLQGTDTAGFYQTFDTKNVGTGKLITPAGVVNDGNPILGNNYTYTFLTSTGSISKRPLAVTAQGINKPYDGTTAATVQLHDDRVAGDVLTASYLNADFADKNAGTGVAISVTGISISGFDQGNYSLSNTSAVASANIGRRAIQITAQPDSKTYDGTVSSAKTPSITSGTYAGTDGPGFTQVFDSPDASNSRQLVPSGVVIDGRGGSNYDVTFVNAAGSISKRSLTVNANATDKTYDGTTAASVTLYDDRVPGDDMTDNYVSAGFADRDFGAAKTVTVSGISISGADAGNYNLSNTIATAAANISKRPITVTAQSYSKVYDGDTTALISPLISGSLGTGDTPNFAEAFSNKNAAANKTLIPSGSVVDGNSGNNYNVSFVNDTTGLISKKAIGHVTADTKSIYDISAFPGFTFQYDAGNLVSGDTIATPPSCYAYEGNFEGASVLTATPPAGSYPIKCSGGWDGNYDFVGTHYVDSTLTVAATNNPPTSISIVWSKGTAPADPVHIPEFQPAGGFLATLIAADPDQAQGDVITFSLPESGDPGYDSVACADNGQFHISGDELQAGLTDPYYFDFEKQSSLNICLQAADLRGSTLPQPQAFTITVDNHYGVPVRFISTSTLDGQVLETGGVNASSATALVGDNKANKRSCAIYSFTTGKLPDDAVVTSATLTVTRGKVVNLPWSGLGNLMVDMKQSFFGTKPGLQGPDFGDLTGVNVASLAADPNPATALKSIALDPTAFRADKFPYNNTQIRLCFQHASVNGKADALPLYTGNAASAALRPVLTVEYSRPAIDLPFTVKSTATQDGQVMVTGAVNATATSAAVGFDKANREIRSILSFNTGALPDSAIVTSVQLKVRRQSYAGTPFLKLGNLVVELKQSNFGNKPTLEAFDFDSPSVPSSPIGTIVEPSGAKNGTWYTVTLDPNAFSLDTAKQLTQLRLRFTGSDSTGPDFIKFYTGNALSSQRPQLVITFSIP